jgi:HSP20 family protein
MALLTWEPMRELEHVMARQLRSLGLARGQAAELFADGEWLPSVDIAENDQAYVIQVELPGVHKQDVKVCVDNGVLLVSGERSREQESKGWHYHRLERSTGRYLRSFTLPARVEPSRLQARFTDGLLEITLPKGEGEQSPEVVVPVE